MKHHEREFFIYRIRIGTVKVDDILIMPPTIEDKVIASEKYIEVYNECLADGVMTEDDIENWMVESKIWTPQEQKQLDTALEDINKLKKEMFNNHANTQMVEQIRKYLRKAETFRNKQYQQKSLYEQNTAEGLAKSEEMMSILKNTTFYKGEKLDDSLGFVMQSASQIWSDHLLTEKQIRELARNAPWVNLWTIKDSVKNSLFYHSDRELTNNQHALVVWSQTYDNIQESTDCPVDYVIADDDMLDGWFLIQSEKSTQMKTEKDFEENTKSDKIKNSGEVYVMSQNKEHSKRIDGMNSAHGKAIKGQRFGMVNKKGSVQQGEFADERLKMQTMSNNQFKDTVTRR
jgi:hypothetical protein